MGESLDLEAMLKLTESGRSRCNVSKVELT